MKYLNTKSLLAVIVALMGAMMASCSKNSAEDMLSLVPEDADMVGLINIEALAESFHGQNPQPIDLMRKLLAKDSQSSAKEFDQLISIKEYIAPEPCVFFESKGYSYLVLNVSDEKNLAEALGKSNEVNLSEKNGYWEDADNHIILKDKLLWICSSKISSSQVSEFANQGKDRSFMASPYAEYMVKSDAQCQMVVNLLSMMDSKMGRSDAMQTRMLLNLLFDSPRYLSMEFNTSKGKMDMRAQILNEKFAPAKISVQLNELPSAMIEAYPGKADMMVGISIAPATIRQIAEKFGGMNASMQAMLNTFDGNILVGFNLKNAISSNFKRGMAIMMGFNSASDASNTAGLLGSNARVFGNYLYLGEDMPEGRPLIDTDKLSGVSLGMCLSFKSLASENGLQDLNRLKSLFISLDKGQKTMVLKGVLRTNDTDLNALTTLLQVANGIDAESVERNFNSTQSYYDYDEADTSFIEEEEVLVEDVYPDL
ncbi:MAG: DUF4836 family protein [Muribaculum sp.]|nr:DUF4836 family protein [Muribaculum sp.]